MCINFYSNDNLTNTDLLSKCSNLVHLKPSLVAKCTRSKQAARENLAEDTKRYMSLQLTKITKYLNENAIIQINDAVLQPNKSEMFINNPQSLLCSEYPLANCQSSTFENSEFFGKNDLQITSSLEEKTIGINPEERERPIKLGVDGEQKGDTSDLDLIYKGDGPINEVVEEEEVDKTRMHHASNLKEEEVEFGNEMDEIRQELRKKHLEYLLNNTQSEKEFMERARKSNEDKKQEKGRWWDLNKEIKGFYMNILDW